MLEERTRRVINVEESISAQLAFQMVVIIITNKLFMCYNSQKEKFMKQDEQKRQDEYCASRQKTIHRLKQYQQVTT